MVALLTMTAAMAQDNDTKQRVAPQQPSAEQMVEFMARDLELTDEQKTKMDDLVSNAGIYEEDSSVFVLGVSEDGTQQMPQGDEDMGIVLDKFDYIQKQIDKIDHPAVDNSKLSEMMREYYNKVLV